MPTEAEVRAILEAAGLDPEADGIVANCYRGDRATRAYTTYLRQPLWQYVMEKIRKEGE